MFPSASQPAPQSGSQIPSWPDQTSSNLLSASGAELSPSMLYKILEVRSAIFVVEQECAYQELDGLDLRSDTTHLWFEDNQGIASYLRLLTDGSDIRIGRVLTRPDRRRTGISTALMTLALQRIGSRTTVLSAQSYLTDFYSSFGYEVSGPEFVEDGIPHVPMRRTASD